MITSGVGSATTSLTDESPAAPSIQLLDSTEPSVDDPPPPSLPPLLVEAPAPSRSSRFSLRLHAASVVASANHRSVTTHSKPSSGPPNDPKFPPIERPNSSARPMPRSAWHSSRVTVEQTDGAPAKPDTTEV